MSDEFLAGGGASNPAIKFTNPGDTAKGVITQVKRLEDRDPNGTVKTWPDGKPKHVFVFTLETDNGTEALWVRGNMVKAIREAATAAGVTTMEGATVAVQFTGLGEPTSKGYAPPKLFKAQVKPASTITTDDLL
jgi:hypothetical protein